MITRRHALVLPALPLFARPSRADPDALWAALAGGGHVALMRHAQTTPGTGDPPDFRLDDCATQRNLSEEGRRSAARLGAEFRRRGVRVGRVLSSEWCRCLDTGQAMDVGPVETAPAALNSFFGGQGDREASTAALRSLIAGLPRDGATVLMITHQVNVTALTGIFPAMGEIVALRLEPGGAFRVAGRKPSP